MSTSPLKEYVLTLEVERPNRGQVLASTRSGAAPAAVETVLQVQTFYCLVTGLLVLDIAALEGHKSCIERPWRARHRPPLQPPRGCNATNCCW